MYYFDFQRLFASQTCFLLLFAYNFAGIGIPFSFVTFTVHQFCSIEYHTKPFLKTKRWIAICIASQWIVECIISLPFAFKQGPVSNDICLSYITQQNLNFKKDLLISIVTYEKFFFSI
jgi:hypothetical protein